MPVHVDYGCDFDGRKLRLAVDGVLRSVKGAAQWHSKWAQL